MIDCPQCGGAIGAHSITCPTLMQSTALPVGEAPSTTPCPSCGARGYHKAICPLALQSRPDTAASGRRPAADVIAKVLAVHEDIGHTIRPKDEANEIMAELVRSGWRLV